MNICVKCSCVVFFPSLSKDVKLTHARLQAFIPHSGESTGEQLLGGDTA